MTLKKVLFVDVKLSINAQLYAKTAKISTWKGFGSRKFSGGGRFGPASPGEVSIPSDSLWTDQQPMYGPNLKFLDPPPEVNRKVEGSKRGKTSAGSLKYTASGIDASMHSRETTRRILKLLQCSLPPKKQATPMKLLADGTVVLLIAANHPVHLLDN